jgi:hypothetical protein
MGGAERWRIPLQQHRGWGDFPGSFGPFQSKADALDALRLLFPHDEPGPREFVVAHMPFLCPEADSAHTTLKCNRGVFSWLLKAGKINRLEVLRRLCEVGIINNVNMEPAWTVEAGHRPLLICHSCTSVKKGASSMRLEGAETGACTCGVRWRERVRAAK